MACYVSRGEKQFYVFLPEDEPTRSMVAREVARALAALVKEGSRRALLVNEVNEEPASKSVLAPFLAEEGFVATAMGMQLRHTESTRPRAGGVRREES
jgi:ATP-dependent Lhr-like helicase